MKFNIYYTKPEYFRGLMLDDDLPKLADLTKTHTLLTQVNVVTDKPLEAIFSMMQAENWSPNGEARHLIEKRQLGHTSMSVGDIVHDCDNDEWFVCANISFKKLESPPPVDAHLAQVQEANRLAGYGVAEERERVLKEFLNQQPDDSPPDWAVETPPDKK